MAPNWMLAAMVVMVLFLLVHVTESQGLLLDKAAHGHAGRKLLQTTCWPGMRLNCPSDTQVECEVGGAGGCSCMAMQACLPDVSGCYVVVNGISTKSCGF